MDHPQDRIIVIIPDNMGEILWYNINEICIYKMNPHI